MVVVVVVVVVAVVTVGNDDVVDAAVVSAVVVAIADFAVDATGRGFCDRSRESNATIVAGTCQTLEQTRRDCLQAILL